MKAYSTFKTLMMVTSLLMVALTTMLTGCSSVTGGDTTRFYALSALAEAKPLSTQQLRLGIGPVKLPRLLKHPQIITRKNQHEIKMAEEHQWGGSLKEDVTQVVADNLANLLGTKQVEHFPWKRHFKPDYQVRIKIQQLDGELGGKSVLKARWWLRVANAGNDKLAEHSQYSVTVKGSDYASYAASLSELLRQLSVEIAGRIRG
jgi:uncharacterized lipoprotein YmbA